MNVTLQSIRKSPRGSSASPVYVLTFLIDGKIRRAHAVVRTRQGNAIQLQEADIDRLLAENMDQGRRVYQVISQMHRNPAPKLPLPLGNFGSDSVPPRARKLALTA